ncbi:MAG: 16S rRNA (guanine(527)-N(7))-methyltransferase RsmG [Streptosporangiales bacterium]
MSVPDPPRSAASLFGDRVDVAIEYAELLAGPGVERGLLGPREAARLWDRHIVNCAVLGELIPAGSSLIDVGSGAGLPGVVLAVLRPDLNVTLVEPMARRTAFLTMCIEHLHLERVDVRRARAEELAGTVTADVVTSRAVARLPRLLSWTIPLAWPAGIVLALKGASVDAEIAELGVPGHGARVPATLAAAGVDNLEVVRVGCGIIDPMATVVRVELRKKARRSRR